MKNKNIWIIIGISIVVIILAVVLVFVLKGGAGDDVVNPPIQEGLQTGDEYANEEVFNHVDTTVVEDNHEDVNTDKLAEVVEKNGKLSDDYYITRGRTQTMLRTDSSKFIVKNDEIYTGVGKQDATEKFSIEVSPGFRNNPSTACVINTVTLSKEEVEQLSIELLADLVGKEITDLFSKVDMDGLKYFDMQAEDGSKGKVKISKNYFDVGGQNRYIYAVDYDTEDTAKELISYDIDPEDPKLLAKLPIFKDASYDIEGSLITVDFTMLYDANYSVVSAYTFTVAGDKRSCSIVLDTSSKTGENLNTQIDVTSILGSDSVNIALETTTPILESMEAAEQKALQIYTGITGNDLKLEDLILTDSGTMIRSYTIIDANDELISIDVKEEANLGYYAVLTIN